MKAAGDTRAIDAMTTEWKKLESKRVWLLETVRDWRDVQREARDGHRKAFLGDVVGLCVEKGAELPEKLRKYKGRYVYRGDWVRDENSEVTLFNALSSSPATLESSKFIDAIGMQPGYQIMQSDATQAYVQAKLKDKDEYWVSLPRECWPAKWLTDPKIMKMDKPVVRLDKALYGHPDSGGHWERHCEAHARIKGMATSVRQRQLGVHLLPQRARLHTDGICRRLQDGWTIGAPPRPRTGLLTTG